MANRRTDPTAFIRTRLPLEPVPSLPAMSLHTARAGSGLGRFLGAGGGTPYWAYAWAGGLALAHHLAARPACVAGRAVLDLGAGSGLVGIAAARAGARRVLAAEIDPSGRAALALNAAANGVAIEILAGDVTAGPPLDVDLVLVGDLFYEAGLAARVSAFLDRCLAAGQAVLVGDPGRAPLPRARLEPVARYTVPDFGKPAGTPAGVYAFTAPPPPAPHPPTAG